MELQVREEVGGVGGYVGDRGRALRAGEFGDAGRDRGFPGEGVSGDVGNKMRDKAGLQMTLPFSPYI